MNANGSLDTSFIDPNLNAGADARVRSLALDSSGRLIIAGDFSQFDGTNYARIARLLNNGALDTSFATTNGADAAVFAVKTDNSDRIVVAGDFTRVNGKNRTRIARLRSDGTLDPSINFGTGPNNFVAAIDLVPVANGAITIGGGFTQVDGIGEFGKCGDHAPAIWRSPE